MHSPCQTPEWIRLVFEMEGGDLELVESFLNAQGAQSIAFKDAADQPLLEPGPGQTPLWEQVRVEAVFDPDSDPSALKAGLLDVLPQLDADTVAVERLQNQAWERAWMDRFQPMRFGDRLWIYPRHIQPPDDHCVHVRLDPGLAFGTGTHPTTSLCLQWLDRHGDGLNGKTVFDYGCGSGVLAIAAARLGADTVYATDIDPQALTATRANADLNGVQQRVRVIEPAALDALPPVDIVLANILSKVLIDRAGELSARVRTGGHLVMSGILEEQACEVRAAYAGAFEMAAPREEEEWVLLEGMKTTDREPGIRN